MRLKVKSSNVFESQIGLELWQLDDEVDINRAWETFRGIYDFSQKKYRLL
jgi:hypothetical protein